MKKPAAKTRTAKPSASKKPAAPVKPVHVPAAVKAARHAAAVKAARTRAVNARLAKAHPRRKLALAEGVACCSAEALAASLRLSGHRVTDEDVLALYRLTAGGPDDGATIAATLEAAQEYGLARVRPANFQLSAPEVEPSGRRFKFPLILGGTLPGGEHAVTLDPSGAVWSWGEPHDPAELGLTGVDEAWLVDWG